MAAGQAYTAIFWSAPGPKETTCDSYGLVAEFPSARYPALEKSELFNKRRKTALQETVQPRKTVIINGLR